MIVKYESPSTRKEFVLNRGYDCAISSCEPYTTEWVYESVKQQYGVNVTSFGKNPITLPITLKYRGSMESVTNNLEEFFRSCESDIIAMTEGKLWIGDDYLSGYFISRSTVNSSEFYGREQTLTFFSPYGFWVRNVTKSFFPHSASSESDMLDYNYGYNYDYARSAGGKAWNVNHYAPMRFTLTIFGPVENPTITVNGHYYTVHDTVGSGDYIVIDSDKMTVTKHEINGQVTNIFDKRGKTESVFAPMQGETLLVNWNGLFGFDLSLRVERSEPEW